MDDLFPKEPPESTDQPNEFSQSDTPAIHAGSPLPARMRPRSLEEVAGQKHILADGCLLRRAIEADRFSSLIFYGPPGTGKTTLASVIAQTTKSRFEALNGVESNVALNVDLDDEVNVKFSILLPQVVFFLG